MSYEYDGEIWDEKVVDEDGTIAYGRSTAPKVEYVPEHETNPEWWFIGFVIMLIVGIVINIIAELH